VPGYILKWRSGKNADGLPLSEVEPVNDEASKEIIRKKIREAENISQVEFW